VSPNFWQNAFVTLTINGPSSSNLNGFTIAMASGFPQTCAIVEKVSDGTGIDKPNTHQLTLNWRSYPTRYVP
jgi:hypothetical protein